MEPTRVREVSRQELIEAAIAVAMEAQAQRRANSRVLRGLPSGWRNSTMPMEAVSFQCGDAVIDVAYRLQRDGRFRLLCDEEEHFISPYECGSGIVDQTTTAEDCSFQCKATAVTGWYTVKVVIWCLPNNCAIQIPAWTPTPVV